jgi:hypothetical protein
MGKAFANHHQGACAIFLDIASEKKRFADSGITGNRSVRVAETLRSDWWGEIAGIPHFDTVGKYGNLHGSGRSVIPVGNGIDDSLANYVWRYFVADWGLNAFGASADTSVDLGEHKVNGHIDLFIDCSLIDAIERYWPLDLRAMEVHAPDFCRGEKLLRVATEEENSGICWLIAGKQMKMGEKIMDWSSFLKRKLPFFPS